MAEDTLARELIDKALPALVARHKEAWLVGGWVRDWLRGRESHDIDFVVPEGAVASAREVADTLGGAFVLLDAERDTARVIVGPDGVYLDFAGLRAPSIEADLLARDFTVNAIALPAPAWNAPNPPLIDPTDGRRDLEQHVLRAVSPDSFQQDPLRMLRGVRLGALLDFYLDSQTIAWIQRDARLLDTVSRERVRDEFAQILILPHVGQSLRQLDEFGLLERVVPELAHLRAVDVAGAGGDALQHSIHTAEIVEQMRDWLAGGALPATGWPYDMLAERLQPYRERLAGYLAETMPGGRPVAGLLSLAALLHDSGKGIDGQECRPVENRLLDHEVLSASLAATVMNRLCFANAEIVRVRLMVRNHMRPGQMAQESSGGPSRRAIYRFFQDAGPAGPGTILLSLADHLALRGSDLDPEHWQRHLALSASLLHAYYERRQEVVEPPPLIDGYELMTTLSLAPGPVVGGLLENIREAQAAGQVRSREQALDLARELLAKGGPI